MSRDVRKRWLMVGLLLAAFALRVYRLDAQSIWWDEGISLHLATSSWGEIVADRLNNIHPPLYFFILKIWATLTGVTPFAARYLSVLASWLQVSAVFVLVSSFKFRVSSSKWLAAVLVAISPLSVVYGQEVRVYAMLPLVYVGILGISYWIVAHPGQVSSFEFRVSSFKFLAPRSSLLAPHSPFLALAFIEWVGLHLHYISLFVVVYTAVFTLVMLVTQKRWTDVRHWFMAQLAVGLASLPWFVAVLRNWAAVQAEANAGTFQTEAVPLFHLISQVWVFHLTGLAGALARPEVQWLAAALAILLGLAVLVNLLCQSSRRKTAVLLMHWLLPLTAAFALWSVRSFSHPRYVAIFAIMLVPLVVSSFEFRVSSFTFHASRFTFHVSRFIAYCSLFTVYCLLFTLSLLSLRLYFFDPGVAKDDVRGVARFLESTVSSNELIFVPDGDWTLFFEYRGRDYLSTAPRLLESRWQPPIAMPLLDDRPAMWANLAAWTAENRRVHVLDYERGTLDWQEVIPFALESAGALTAVNQFGDLLVRTYDLDAPIAPPVLQPVNSQFGPLLLQEAWVEPVGDTAVTVAARWQVQQPITQRYSFTIRLLEMDDWVLTVEDDVLVDENGRSTDQWQPGQVVTTYHVLPLFPGIPTFTYRVVAGLYGAGAEGVLPVEWVDAAGVPQGQWAELGEVTVEKRLLTNPYALPDPLESRMITPLLWPAGLLLLASSPLPVAVQPGQPIVVQLRWQATLEQMPDMRPRLALMQNGQVLAVNEELPVLGRYPTHLWQLWEVVLEHRSLMVPPAASGPAEIVLSVGEEAIVLGTVQIEGQARLFEPPVISQPLQETFASVGQLVGYDLPNTTYTTADSIPLTLYWQATESGNPTAYTVFTQLLDENGRLIAQHDSPPGGGQRPTPGWVEGEYIVDPHLLTFREIDYSGRATLVIGLYDPVTGERVLLENGRDALMLPTVVIIVSE